MTDDDAWYYACLHADVGIWYGDGSTELREHAQMAGLTKVRWEELP
nr:DUF6555 family protein [Pseudomonas fluorescens]